MTSALRKITAAACTFALAAVIAFLLQSPARAQLGPSLDIEPSETVSNTPVLVRSGTVDFTAYTSDSSAQPMLILAKFEGGPNDPDTSNGNPDNYGAPDGSCTIDVGNTQCDLTLEMPNVQTTTDFIRFWINGRRIDLAKPTFDAANGCIDPPGYAEATDLVEVKTVGIVGGGPGPKNGPVAGALANPPTCPIDDSVTYANDEPNTPPDQAGGASTSATPISTSTDSGSATSTASPSSTPSDTSSPTASSSPSVSESTSPPSPTTTPTSFADQSCGSTLQPWVLTGNCNLGPGDGSVMSARVVSVDASATSPLTAAVHIEAVDADNGTVLAQCSNSGAGGVLISTVRCNSSTVFNPPIGVSNVTCTVFGVVTGSYSCDVSP
ncbi:MAG: hypothetical protein ACYDCC_11015 [Actinomycetota bacterium]